MSEYEATWERLDKAHAHRLALLAGGYVPIPVNGKRPTNANWQNDVAPSESEIVSWKAICRDAFNTGILTKWTPAIDIDVTDNIVANAIAGRAAELVAKSAPLLVRFGKQPKRAILFRTDEPFDKIRTADFTSPDGATHHVEILCDGQQIVAFGRHPDTGCEYEWRHRARRTASATAIYLSSPRPWRGNSLTPLPTSCATLDGKKRNPGSRPAMTQNVQRLHTVKVAIANVNMRRRP